MLPLWSKGRSSNYDVGLQGGSLGNGYSFTRSSTAGSAEAPLAEFAVNTPRYDSLGMLVVEGNRVNGDRNPRAEGAVAPTTPPTNWSMANVPAGVTINVIPFVSGTITGLDLDISGSGSGAAQLSFETTTQIVAAAGQSWSATLYHQLISGSLSNLGFQLGVRQGLATGAFVADSTPTGFNPSATMQRVYNPVLTAATTERVMNRCFILTAGAVTGRVRLVFPQAEINAPFPSSFIVPTAGSLVASTRTADRLLAPVASYTGGFAARTMLPQAAPASGPLPLWQRDDGSDSNRVVVECAAGGTSIQARVISAGVTTATMVMGNATVGVPFAWTVGLSSALQVAQLRGGAEQSAAVSLPTGLASDRPSHGASNWTAAGFNRVGPVLRFRSYPGSASALALLP